MNRKLAAAGLSVTLLAGVGVGATVFGPVSATAHNEAGAPAHTDPPWFTDALGKLVDDGTINQAQADAVAAALRQARPKPGDHPRRPHPGMAAAAEALGISEADLAAARREGKTLAEVAGERNVPVSRVIDALVEDATEHLNQAVEDGRLPRERADRMIAGLRERITARVNGEGPQHGSGGQGMRPGPGGHGGGPGHRDSGLRPGPQDAEQSPGAST